MAINVNTVYKTVLLILNQQQRGYMTPDEFNKVADQVQLNVFEGYFEDLNQQYRVPQNDTEYSNRVENLEQKLQYFQRTGTTTGANPFTPVAGTTTYNGNVVTDTIYRVGSVFYKGVQLNQYAQRNEITQLLLSPLTQPTTDFPIFLYENDKFFIYPTSIITPADITFSYVKKPEPPIWGYGVGTLGQFEYASGTSINFELAASEQSNVITRVLAYAGVIINDPTIVQVASQEIAAEQQNAKQ
jgi:hypothetical protein|tara:strand:+ start:189 stop:917 length:729 start_codon:yes stop_codon:yes gene_type:complete